MEIEEIKDLIVKYISTFSLENLINIVTFKGGICRSCEHYKWLKPSWKHSFWGCNISTNEFDENYKCFEKKFEPHKEFLETLKK